MRGASCGALALWALLTCRAAAADSLPELPPPSAAMLAGGCAGCHGAGGVSRGPAIPTIAGLSKNYFTDTMNAFKYGLRHGTVMDRIARGYSGDEIKAMAGYFSLQVFAGRPQKSDPAMAARGRRLHRDNCEKCHENDGRDSDDGGILAGQWTPYLRSQIDDFLAGVNRLPHKMQIKLEALNASDVDALLNFYASQY